MKNKKGPSRKHVLRILEWCEEKYGMSRYNYGLPSVRVSRTEDHEGLAGYYDDEINSIVVHLKLTDTLEELCSTVIEEWTHYLQSSYKYQLLAKKYDYSDHPYEVEAKRIAERDHCICLEELRTRHNYFDF